MALNDILKLPPSGKFVDQLRAAGIQTKAARGFWGGVTPEGEIVVTSWLDDADQRDPSKVNRFYIYRPKTNHGGLKTAWEVGNIRVGTEVRMILIKQRGTIPVEDPGRSVASARLMPRKWRVVEMVSSKKASIEQI